MQASYNMFKGALIQFDCSEINEAITFLHTMATGFKQYPDTREFGEKIEEMAIYIHKQHKACGHT